MSEMYGLGLIYGFGLIPTRKAIDGKEVYRDLFAKPITEFFTDKFKQFFPEVFEGIYRVGGRLDLGSDAKDAWSHLSNVMLGLGDRKPCYDDYFYLAKVTIPILVWGVPTAHCLNMIFHRECGNRDIVTVTVYERQDK